LSLTAPKGKAPLAVSNSTEVKKLNVGLLDGFSASGILKEVTGHCAAGGAVVSVTPRGVTCTTVAAPIIHVINISVGATATVGGTYLKDVLAAITDATATDGYRINLGPGVFDLGTASLDVPSHIDVVGSGVDLTTITSSVDGGTSIGPTSPTGATVDLAADTTLRDLSVINTSAITGGEFEAGVESTTAGGPVTVDDVDISVPTAGAGVGIDANGGSTLNARDLTIAVAAAGFGEAGRGDAASTLTIADSRLAVTAAPVFSIGSNTGSTVKVVNTQMPSGASFNDGSTGTTVTCFDDYTPALAAATC
jgi:hypothetical protein